jgi:hypothetical protein
VISASRRTDIPALYSAWFMERVRHGFCHWMNPFGGQVYRVSLAPEDVVAFVFWTRNARPLSAHLDELDERGFHYYFHYTITDYPSWMEPHAPRTDRAIAALKELSGRIGASRVIWRYDPIIVGDRTPVDYHLRRFGEIAAKLRGSTTSCYFSFATFYGKTERNLAKAAEAEGATLSLPSGAETEEICRVLVDVCARNDMTLSVCSCDALVGEAVLRGSCINARILRDLRPDLDLAMKTMPTRPDCGCCEATDIGAFDTCTFGCTYCYATTSYKTAIGRRRAHDANDSILWRPSTLIGLDLATVERPAAPPGSRIVARSPTLFGPDVSA